MTRCGVWDQRLEEDPQCPHCGSTHIEGWGQERNGRSAAVAGTAGEPSIRDRYAASAATQEGVLAGLCRSTERIPIGAQGRQGVQSGQEHRLQVAPPFSEGTESLEGSNPAGIAEIDEIFLLESFKGQRKLPRPARKRGGVAEKPGLSAEQIPILIARNRTGAHIDAVLPDRSEAAVRPVLEGKLSKNDTLLCMDGDKALIAFAEAEGIEYELIIASKGEHVHEKVLHIQNVNAYGGRFKQWLDRFNGVATKYLQSYLGWRRWLERAVS